MKRIFLIVSLCVIFSFSTFTINITYCMPSEMINFCYNEKVFSYSLSKNTKKSNQFDVNYEINKYNRFGDSSQRKQLADRLLAIGFEPDIIVNYLYPNIDTIINRIAKNIYRPPRDARLEIDTNTNKVFLIQKERNGIMLDRETLYQNILSTFDTFDKDINIPIKTLLPKISSSQYEKYSHLRSDFSTDISNSNADRKHNIKNALNSLNKIEIYPNEIFSFNKVVGRRTAENGYRTAKIIVDNEFVDGIGGGVCQVSSTLYNSALLAGMEILEANKHSKQIHYVKYGFDAMVNFGSSDLKFRNTTNQKITIITNYSANKIRIRLFGEDMNNISYRLTNDVLNVVTPSEEIRYDEKQEYLDKVVYEDEYFYLKQGHLGMDIKSYREKYNGDSLVEVELLRTDKYSVQNAVKIYGTKKRED